MRAQGMWHGVRRDWRIVAGLALMYLWTWLIYWGGPFSLRTYTMELTNARWGVNVVMAAVAIGGALLAACRVPERRLASGLRVAALASGLCGTLLSLAFALALPLPEGLVLPLAVATGVFTGACEGCLLCLWCSTTSALGMRAALTFNVLGMALSGLLFLACNVTPAWLSLAAGLLCPVAGFLCSLGRSRLDTPASQDSSFAPVASLGSQAPAPARPAAHGLRDALAPLLRDRSFLMLAAISLIFGLSHGFMNASFEVVPKEVYWLSCYGVVIGTILAAALTFLTAYLLKMDAWQLVFRTSLPLMAVAYLLFPYELFWFVGPGIHALGYQYFFITFWSLLGSKQLRHDVPAARSVALGLFVTNAGAALGLCLWNLTCVGIDVTGLRVVSSLATLLILVVAVSFERPPFGWGNVRPGAAAPTGEGELLARDYEGVIAHIRARYGLSPRETDVCGLLGRGRNRQFVADELGISLETAKTHTTNVYRKLGIHSQQELLDVIEMAHDTLARERRDH